MGLRRVLLAVVLTLALALSACSTNTPQLPLPINPNPVENTVTISLYFADANASELVLERREVVRRNEPLEALVLRELIAGPSTQGAVATIPPEAKVISVQVVESVAFVNFSRELATRHSGGSAGEQMTLGSIVYSLTELPGIEKVQLLIEGEKQESIFGHSITIEPIGREVLQPYESPGVGIMSSEDPWQHESPELAGPVTAVAVGNFTGSGSDIVAAAGGRIYVFSYVDGEYREVWQMVFDRYVTGLVGVDFTKRGTDYIVVAGAASGNWNPNVPGFLTVLDFRDGQMFRLADISKEGMPFWSVTAMDIEGTLRPEILASNGNGVYVYSVDDEFELRQLHLLSRFSGTVAAEDRVLAWRDSSGTRLSLLEWQGVDWEELWTRGGGGEWLVGTPAFGLTTEGEPLVVIGNLAGELTAWLAAGEDYELSAQLQAVVLSLDSRTSPAIIPSGEIIIGGGGRILVLK
ncbi:MAG TPA: GerMN domain-containing protein [Bacillota bacterium]|nr:GerMN domain-containing protein [Bacillota bacterium]